MRILHFSDVHLWPPHLPLALMLPHMREKRFVGWLNLLLSRQRLFNTATHKVRKLATWMQGQDIDLSICTGDYTALGTSAELHYARNVIDPLTKTPLGFVTLPGNHDLYCHDCIDERRFERYFGEFLHSDILPDRTQKTPWPILKLPSDDVAIIAINSARPTDSFLNSNGYVSTDELEALDQLLRHDSIQSRFTVIALHYAPRLASGKPDSRRHGLDNADALLELCQVIKKGMMIFGHVHHRYRVDIPKLNIPLFNSGSLTHRRHESFWLYDIEGKALKRATPGLWNGTEYALGSIS